MIRIFIFIWIWIWKDDKLAQNIRSYHIHDLTWLLLLYFIDVFFLNIKLSAWRSIRRALTFPFFRCTMKGFVKAASLVFPRTLSAVDPWRTFFFSDRGDAWSIFTFESWGIHSCEQTQQLLLWLRKGTQAFYPMLLEVYTCKCVVR